MTDVSNRRRQGAGQPTGGEFAVEAKGTDTGVVLDVPAPEPAVEDDTLGVALTPAEYEATLAKVDKINTRATKRGFTGVLAVEAKREVIINSRDDRNVLRFPNQPPGAEVVRYRTRITGEPPRYEGWEFLASLDSLTTADGGTEWLVNCSPGVDDEQVDRSRLTAGACEHCNTTRHNRRKLMLVRNAETGEYKQVGASCIKDFLGWSAQPVFVNPDEAIERSSSDAPEPASFTPHYAATVALAAAQAYGWCSRSGAGEHRAATVDLMTPYLHGPSTSTDEARRADEEIIARIEEHMPAARAKVDEVVDTVLNDFSDAEHGYEANLRSALRAEFVGSKQMALTASVVAAHERIIGRRTAASAAEDRQKQWDEWEPQYLGDVGEKVEFTGKVVTAMTVDGYAYNSTQRLVVIQTETGMAKFYSSAGWTYDVDSGDTVSVKAQVKKHDEYKGKKQTVVKAPKIVGDIQHEARPLDDDDNEQETA